MAEEFVDKHLALLELERTAEELQTQTYISSQLLEDPKLLESKGVCIQKLQVTARSLGLYGREVVTFERGYGPSKHPIPLSSHTITTGCIVAVFVNCKSIVPGHLLSGVVLRCSSTHLRVAFDELPGQVDFSAHTGRLQLVKMNNSATHKRMKKSLLNMKSLAIPPPIHHFIDVLFGQAQLGRPDPKVDALQFDADTSSEVFGGGISFFNPNLDLSQKKAVVFALGQAEVAVIHGPPGTGKTTTLIEVILQAVARGMKILACAPSNIAVDNMVERLTRARAKVVRVGHPARLVEAVQKHSLDALLSRLDSASILSDVRGDLEAAMGKCRKASLPGDKRKWRTEIKVLRKELKEREERAILQLLSGADVVLATTSGAHSSGPLDCLPEGHFGMVVIDECAQAVEGSCWIPLLHSNRCVLAGDHKQLPPTIISQEAAAKGLAVSLMERLVSLYGNAITRMLTTQYRMNEKIMHWPSEYLYNNSLQADQSVAQHCLAELPGVTSTDMTSIPLLFLDTAGLDIAELVTPDEESKGNEGEADLVLHHLRLLLEAGISPSDMAVIAPYNLQVELIRKRLAVFSANCSALEVRSVDGFQGREKEAVIISFTRSNVEGQCGFLHEIRRSNVAITRARRHLALIGDSSTLSHEPFLKGMFDYCMENGEVWSAQQYMSASDFTQHQFYQEGTKSVTASTAPSASTNQASSHRRAHHSVKPKSKGSRNKSEREESQKSQQEASSGEVGDSVSEDLKARLLDFIKNNEVVLSFPTSLSSYHRRIVHEMSEQLGLVHTSHGEEPDRYIEVKKPTQHRTEAKVSSDVALPPEAANVQVKESGNSSNSEEEPRSEDEPQVSLLMAKCSICHKLVPEGNIVVHTAVAHKSAPSKDVLPPPPPTHRNQSKTKPKSRKSEKQRGKPEAAEEDLDSLLAEATLANSTCAYTVCKKKVNVLGLHCQFCRRKFCMEHGIPEVHGCADEAKRYARSTHAKPGQSSSQAARRGNLQKKLEKKLETMSADRQAKTKTKPKSK